MKKFMKGCGIAALILLILGVILAVVSVALKGTDAIRDTVESVTGGRLHVDLDPSDDEWGVFFDEDDAYYDIEDDTIFDNSREILNGDVDRYEPGSGIRDLVIEVGGCALTIQESEDDRFYVETGNIGRFQCYQEGDTLYVKSTLKAGKLNLDGNEVSKHRITLYVPAGYRFDDVDISFGAGTLEIGQIASQDMSLEVGAGQILVDGLSADSCEIEVGMGEIVLSDMQVGELDAECGMGSLEISGSVLGDLDVSCGMGSVEMDLEGSRQDFNYEVEAAMGSVSIDGDDFSGLAQDRSVNNGAARTMSIECSMGSIEVEFH